jgi:predicted MFS family arabinose efflux permease
LAAGAWSGDVLVLARVAQGASAALMVPQVLSSIQALFGPDERAPVLGVLAAVGGLGVLAGQLLGGWLVTVDAFGLGWRSVFVINAPVGVLLVLATLRFVPDTRAERPLRLDLTGVALATAGLVLLVVPLVEGREHGWPAWAWAMLAAVPAVVALFVRQQARREAAGAALVPTRLFARRGFAAGLGVQLAFHLGWGSFALVFGLYVQQGLGFTPLEMGLAMLPITIGAFAGTAIAAPFAARAGRGMVIVGGLLQAVAFAWYALVVDDRGAALSGWDLALPLGFGGVGMILLAVPLMDLTLAAVDGDDAGAASGVFNTVQQLGSALGVALVGVVFFGVLGADPSPARFEDALLAGVGVTMAAFVLAALAGALLPARAARLADPPSPLAGARSEAA